MPANFSIYLSCPRYRNRIYYLSQCFFVYVTFDQLRRSVVVPTQTIISWRLELAIQYDRIQWNGPKLGRPYFVLCATTTTFRSEGEIISRHCTLRNKPQMIVYLFFNFITDYAIIFLKRIKFQLQTEIPIELSLGSIFSIGYTLDEQKTNTSQQTVSQCLVY